MVLVETHINMTYAILFGAAYNVEKYKFLFLFGNSVNIHIIFGQFRVFNSEINTEIKTLIPVEISEYEGQMLSSIGRF